MVLFGSNFFFHGLDGNRFRLADVGGAGPFLTTKKITIRDLFIVNRDFFCHDSRQNDRESRHEFL